MPSARPSITPPTHSVPATHPILITYTVEFATVGTPMQCIQIKMAHDAYSAAPKFKGFVDAAAGIVREEGGHLQR